VPKHTAHLVETGGILYLVWVKMYIFRNVSRQAKRPLGRRRRRLVDNIKMDLREMGWCGLGWIDMGSG
jgi:hypothetical protein